MREMRYHKYNKKNKRKTRSAIMKKNFMNFMLGSAMMEMDIVPSMTPLFGRQKNRRAK